MSLTEIRENLSPNRGRLFILGGVIVKTTITREVTLAGELIGTRSGKIDEMDYVYPLFEIKLQDLFRKKI